MLSRNLPQRYCNFVCVLCVFRSCLWFTARPCYLKPRCSGHSSFVYKHDHQHFLWDTFLLLLLLLSLNLLLFFSVSICSVSGFVQFTPAVTCSFLQRSHFLQFLRREYPFFFALRVSPPCGHSWVHRGSRNMRQSISGGTHGS